MSWRRLLGPIRILVSGALLAYLIWRADPVGVSPWQRDSSSMRVGEGERCSPNFMDGGCPVRHDGPHRPSSGGGHMLRSIIVFVLVLVALNALFALLNLDIRISIVGSLVLSALVGLIMELVRRR